MTRKELKDLIEEREHVELKSSLSLINEIIEAVSAFSNAEGGKIIVGVNNAGKVLGVEIGKGTIENLANTIGQNTDPKVQPTIKVETIDKKKIVIIVVKESLDKLVLAFGRPFKRVGKSSPKMSKDEYESLILEKHREKLQFDNQICRDIQLKEIDGSKVKWFLQKAKEERKFDVNPNISMKEAMERLGLVEDGGLTNAAVLLFGKEPQKFFLQSKIRCARFKGINGLDYIDMKVLDGTLPELREKAMKFIMQHTKHGVFFDANQRYDRWEYPLRALEEVLSNALAHRDYYSNAEIQLSIYDDRIEVWNPGELPKSLTTADLKRKHRSIPRNKLIADKLFLIKYIEQWGKGTNRMIEWMRKENLPEPKFQNTTSGFEVILVGPGKSFEEEIEKQKLHKLELNERQMRAIEYIKEKGIIKREEYIKINKVSHTTASNELKGLVEKNIFRKTGKGKYLRYELTQG